jgi:hypothetical protein
MTTSWSRSGASGNAAYIGPDFWDVLSPRGARVQSKFRNLKLFMECPAKCCFGIYPVT